MKFLLHWMSLSGFFLSVQLEFAQSSSVFQCDEPYWMSPAESHNGTFTGDLANHCWSVYSREIETLEGFREKIIQKIEKDSIIHEGPIALTVSFPPSLKWEVSHHFKEGGNSIQIREEIILNTPSKNELFYETQSKEVKASGMASYLNSVLFKMVIQKKSSSRIDIEFRNQVKVSRPWYALDLVFAPIAKNVCLEKMEKVKKKFMSWFTE